MGRLIKSEQGFSAVEAVLILVIVGIVGFIGWYVYQAKNKTTGIYNNAAKSTGYVKTTSKAATNPSTTAGQSAQQYLTVKEWGIKIPITNDVAGLSYTMSQNSANFRDTALNNVSGSCTTNSIVLVRGKANDKAPGETGAANTFAQTYDSIRNQDYSTVTTKSIAVKIGDYYYVPSGYAGASCASDSSTQSQETTTSTNIIKALRQMVAI